MPRLNTAAWCTFSSVTNANLSSGETATSNAPSNPLTGTDDFRVMDAGAARVPSTAPAPPRSARATLITTAPSPSAASRYRPSLVMVSPSGVPGTWTVATSAGASEPGAPGAPAVLNTSIEVPTATNAQRPSGVTATPNGWPGTPTIAVRTKPSEPDGDVAVAHRGDGSPRDGSGGIGVTAAPAVGEAITEWRALPLGAEFDVQAAQAATAVAVTAAYARARSERIAKCYESQVGNALGKRSLRESAAPFRIGM